MKRTLLHALILIAISGGVAAATALFHPRAPAWYLAKDFDRWVITIEQATALGSDVLWVDARKDSEFAAGHVPGAILLNEERWGDLVFEHQDRLQSALGKPVVVYCEGSGCERSSHIAARLRELIGLEPVHVLRGDWRQVSATSRP